jgi:putative glycerol-1-phosphate prenyltransferase
MSTIDFSKKRQLAWLIDPDKADFLDKIPDLAKIANVDYFFVGGSLLKNDFLGDLVIFLKKNTDIPVILFPGSAVQIVPEADAILFLSLISGRNPDFLIGQQVLAAPLIYHHKIKTIPTGYILIDSGKPTSVSYISQTTPVPADKPDIVVATALAGQYLGMQCIYLEGGSGAANCIDTKLVQSLKKVLDIPIMVGGGINTPQKMKELYNAGCNLVVVGTAFENNPTEDFMKAFKERE